MHAIFFVKNTANTLPASLVDICSQFYYVLFYMKILIPVFHRAASYKGIYLKELYVHICNNDI